MVIVGGFVALLKGGTEVPSVSGTTWSAHENGKRFIEYSFNSDGTVSYWNYRYWRNGTWKQDGKMIFMETNRGYAMYVGEIEHNVMTVSAKNVEGKEWSWLMQKSERVCGPTGDSVLQSHIGKKIDELKARIQTKPLDITWGEERYYAWDSRSFPSFADKPACVVKVQVDKSGAVIGSDIQGDPCSCTPFAVNGG